MGRGREHNVLISHEPLHLRAADADRERTADFLGRRCAEGRLSPEELSGRLERVYAALTYGELAAVVSDLPGDPPSGDRWRRPRTLTVSAATVCAVLVVGLSVYGLAAALAAAPVATVLVLGGLGVLAALTLAMLASLLVAVAPVAAVALGAVWLGRHLERRRGGGRTR